MQVSFGSLPRRDGILRASSVVPRNWRISVEKHQAAQERSEYRSTPPLPLQVSRSSPLLRRGTFDPAGTLRSLERSHSGLKERTFEPTTPAEGSARATRKRDRRHGPHCAGRITGRSQL